MDIIVCFDEKKMGYGDILFAAKLTAQLKQSLITQKKLIGNVYLVCSDDNRGLTKFQNARADCEFGINFILLSDVDRLIAEGKIMPAMIIDAPAPMLQKIRFNNPDTSVIVSLEYTYGPYQTIRLGTSYARADAKKQDEYRQELVHYEKSLLSQYRNTRKQIIRTGLINELGERGIISTEELHALGSSIHNVTTDLTEDLKQKLFNRLSSKTRNALIGRSSSFTQYQQQCNLSFGYGYSGSREFIQVHQACNVNGSKDEDVFLVTDNKNVKDWLSQTINTLKGNGFIKVVYFDLVSGLEHVLYDEGISGKTYRLLHANSLQHFELSALYGISGPLALATGDQSFAEAIQTNKIIAYDCFPHKELLYSAYQDLGAQCSLETKKVLRLLRLNKSVSTQDFQNELFQLADLINNPSVRAELSALNELIRQRPSLVEEYLREINLVLPAVSTIDRMIMDDLLEPSHLAKIVNPEHFFLAIRYGSTKSALLLVNHDLKLLMSKDVAGNNPFTIAAQNQRFDLLTVLLKKAKEHGLNFEQICEANDHYLHYRILDYIPIHIKEDDLIMGKIFGDYAQVLKQSSASSSFGEQRSPLVQCGFYKVKDPEIEELPFWQLIEEHVLGSNNVGSDEELKNRIFPFLVVMRERFKNDGSQQESLRQVMVLCQEMDIPENWAQVHKDEFAKYQDMVLKEISENNQLKNYDFRHNVTP